MTDGVSRRTTLAALAAGATPFRREPRENWMTGPVDLSHPGSGKAPFIKTRSALEKLREIGASVRDTGAVGDGRTDDTAALQEIADYFARVGGEWFFPEGVFRTSAPLTLGCSQPQRIHGLGRRGVYPGRYDLGNVSGLAVILPVHAGRAAVQFAGSRGGEGTIELRGLALATLETGLVPVAGFAWDAAGGFLRDFVFVDCSVHGFTSAFDLHRTGGGNAEMGLFKASRCTINRNLWIARTLDGAQWNGFSFCDNEAGQNGYAKGEGGIAISAHNAVIAGNCLEGQRDPIIMTGAMQGISIRDNYFEANVGNAAIHLQNTRGQFDVGTNTFLAVDVGRLRHLVLLTNCGPGRVLGSYWANGVHKMALPIQGNSGANNNSVNTPVDTDGLGVFRLDGFDSGNLYLREPSNLGMSKQRVTPAGRELAPWNGQPMPVAHHDTARTSVLAFDHTIAGSAGDWVVMSWLFRRDTKAGQPADPYISLSVNGTGALGSKDYTADVFDEYWREGEWCLLTAAIRLKTAMSRLLINIYPYGIKPESGCRSSYIAPSVYVTDAPSKVTPYIDDFTARSVLRPPAVRGFRHGDILINAAVTGPGQAHYVKLEGADDRWAYA